MSQTVRVIRAGTAVAVGDRVIRRVDLCRQLGDATLESPRFLDATLTGDQLALQLATGVTERVKLNPVAAAAARCADVVVETTGQLVTAASGDDRALGIIQNAAIAIAGDRVIWVGPRTELATSGIDISTAQRIDARDRLVTPGLIDCHAHPLFAGNRANEFALRAQGADYREIAAAGGGIAATLVPTRAASFEQHVHLTFARMSRALAEGTTTCEAKSGYDLTVDGEVRLLEVAQAVDALHAVDLVPTLLGAHVVPPERNSDRDGFVAEVADVLVPRVAAAGLAHAVDVYCDDGAFTLDETRRILTAGRDHGLVRRAHVGQFVDLGGPQLIAELGGTSADHLEAISDDGIAAMAHHGVVAVMLPGACVQLRQTPPPVARLRDGGVHFAVASDMNPGTSMGETLPLQMWLAVTHYGLTVDEAWLGVTRHAARALARSDVGVIAPGMRADLVLWDAETPAEIPYRYGTRLVHQVIKSGRAIAG